MPRVLICDRLETSGLELLEAARLEVDNRPGLTGEALCKAFTVGAERFEVVAVNVQRADRRAAHDQRQRQRTVDVQPERLLREARKTSIKDGASPRWREETTKSTNQTNIPYDENAHHLTRRVGGLALHRPG